MPDINNPIDDFAETSTSSPLRTRPTDKQMGLGTHNLLKNKPKKNNQKPKA